MNDLTQTLVRTIVKALAGYLIGKGLLQKSSEEAFSGALLVLAGAAWGVFHQINMKRKPGSTASSSVSVWLAFLSAPMLLTGCQGVPTTTVKFNPQSGALTVKSPKQVSSHNFKASIAKDGSAQVSWDDLSATNAPDVIQTAGAADAARITATAGLVHEVGATLGAAAGTALKAAAGVPASPVTPGPSSIAFPPTPTAPNVPKPVIVLPPTPTP